MTAPDALPGYHRLIDSAAVAMNARVSSRIALTLPLDRPGRHLADITTPTLIQVCQPDTVATDGATLRHIQRAANPAITVERVLAGHFDIYGGAPFVAVTEGQVSFLHNHVAAPSP